MYIDCVKHFYDQNSVINCALKNKQKVGLNKCYPYNLLKLSYLKRRPDCLNITLSDTSSINRPCCVIPKIETAEHNFSSDKNKCKNLQFWLLTLQNIDRNSWQRISSGIENLNSTGEFIISSGRIATSEKGRERLTTSYHEDVSDDSSVTGSDNSS